MTVYGYGSADPKLLEKYDHLPPEQAIIRAWTEEEPSPRWHALAIRDVHNAMPLLARAVERLVQRDLEWREDEIRRRTVADELKDDLFEYGDSKVFDDIPVTDMSGQVVGTATVIHGPGNKIQVTSTLHDPGVMAELRGNSFIGAIPTNEPFLNDRIRIGGITTPPVDEGSLITDAINTDPDEVARLTKAREQARAGQTIRAHRVWEYIENFLNKPSIGVQRSRPESTDLPEPTDPPSEPQP